MFALKDGERLYLSSWEYNAMLIINELARIVKESGGRVKPGKTAVISNRSVSSRTRELAEKIDHLVKVNDDLGESTPRNTAIESYKREVGVLEAFDNTPVEVLGQSWLSFVLGDKYYSYSFDDNPFFDFRYQKATIRDGKYNANACSEEDKREWEQGHEIWSHKLSAEERSDIARAIFDMLISARDSEIIRHKHKTMVPNTYNDGYHYEMVYEKDRYSKIDF